MFSDELKIPVPNGYATWGDAIEGFWCSMENDEVPEGTVVSGEGEVEAVKAPEKVWKAFEQYALNLMPKVTS